MMEKFDSKNCLTGTPGWMGGGGERGSASSPHTSGSTPVNFDIIVSPKSAYGWIVGLLWVFNQSIFVPIQNKQILIDFKRTEIY